MRGSQRSALSDSLRQPLVEADRTQSYIQSDFISDSFTNANQVRGSSPQDHHLYIGSCPQRALHMGSPFTGTPLPYLVREGTRNRSSDHIYTLATAESYASTNFAHDDSSNISPPRRMHHSLSIRRSEDLPEVPELPELLIQGLDKEEPPYGEQFQLNTQAAGGIMHGGVNLAGFWDTHALVVGFINAMVSLPSTIAYAAIVFQAPIYASLLGSFCKFFFFSSAIHQLVFLFLSKLPFAVGQVQDVGLIFLSAMATSIATQCQSAGLDTSMAVTTTLLTITVSTTLVGLGTTAVGRFKLAQLVQYVHLPR